MMRELVPSFLLASGVTTFLLLIRSLFQLADLFISHTVSGQAAFRVLVLGLPNIVVLTIPIGLLFSVLMTATRMSTDSELIAAQACGIKLSRLVRPVIGMAFLLFVLDALLTVVIMPQANRDLTDLMRKTAMSGVRTAVEQGAFTEDFPNHLLYVDRISPTDGTWRGVLLFDRTSPLEERLITADHGEFVQDPRTGQSWLNLRETTSHVFKPSRPRDYQRTSNREQRIRLQNPEIADVRIRRSVRETSSEELYARISDGDRQVAREALVELNKRFAIPAATLVFALVGFPLGIRNRRGGKGFGLTASVGLVAVYYVLLQNGETLVASAHLPVGAGIWLPNVLLFALGVTLLRRAVRGVQRERRGWMSWIRWQRRPVDGTATQVGPVTAAIRRQRVSRVRCADDAAPARTGGAALVGIFDRHLIRVCLGFFVLVLVAVFSIYIVLNLSENIDEIHKNQVPLLVVASYYFFQLPQILHDIVPLVFLIAFLGTTAILERNNESTALRAAGVSLARVGAPLLGLAAVLGALLFFVDDSVVQRANRTSQRLLDVIKGRKVARSYRATDKPWLFLPDGRTLVNFLQYDPDTDTLLRPSIYVFDEHLNLRSLFMAREAVYANGRWLGEGAWSRVPGSEGTADFVQHAAPVELPIDVPPQYFGREYRKPSQMSFGELRSYISTLRAAGYRVDKLIVQLHQKLAYPLSLVVLAWLALPYAFRMGRRGTIMGIALALVLGMAYFATTAFVTKLGEASLLPPALAAWTPTVIFTLLAINRFTTLRT